MDDKQRISFGLRMNQSTYADVDDKVVIKMMVKLFALSVKNEDTDKTGNQDGYLVLSIYDKGHTMRLSLVFTSNSSNHSFASFNAE